MDKNQKIYEAQKSVTYFTEYSHDLLAAEREILDSLRDKIKNKPLLDIGVGAGRTTGHLFSLSNDYIGTDYSDQMILACRQQFPGIDFATMDARDLSALGDKKFSLAFFSFNGIDYAEHEDRLKIYREILRVLSPGGYFLFSSHNPRNKPRSPWFYFKPKNTDSFTEIARHYYHWLAGLINYYGSAHKFKVSRQPSYSILPEHGQNFRLLTYYADPTEVVRQLHESGFTEVQTFDRGGFPQPPESQNLDLVDPVHYLARKPF